MQCQQGNHRIQRAISGHVGQPFAPNESDGFQISGRQKIMCACTGRNGQKKNLYYSEAAAREVATERTHATGIRMYTYKCPFGQGWHISGLY